MTAPENAAAARPSRIGRILRAILRALLFAFAFGFAVGTLIRCSAERSSPPPIQYLGESDADAPAAAKGSGGPA